MPWDNLSIFPVQSRAEFREFLRFPKLIYQDDPHWVSPLWYERKNLLHPKKNPFYQHAQVKLFLAKKSGQTVGRISAQIDEQYYQHHGERVGHFGFFESIKDPTVARALLETAEEFFRHQQVKKVQGPFSFSINEESGLLIEGFEQPMMTMMPYNPQYYPALIEAAGYRKAKDLFAWKYLRSELPQAPQEIADQIRQHPGLVLRSVSKKNFKSDIRKIMDIFSETISQNWGFVPPTPAEVDKISKDLKMIMDPEIAFLAEIDGEPAAMCLGVPNLYDLIAGLKGRLFPTGALRLLWRIKKRKWKSGRLMLLGVKDKYRKTPLGALSILLYVEVHRRVFQQGYDYGELSWTLEDNHTVNAGIEFMGGKKYKTYRIYEKEL